MLIVLCEKERRLCCICTFEAVLAVTEESYLLDCKALQPFTSPSTFRMPPVSVPFLSGLLLDLED
jgi:hypothetical protein